MGELILCRQSIAAVPYYLEESSLNIYSLEELSYYIAHNIYLLKADFMNLDLCHWIGRELKQKELEEQLLALLTENTPLHIFVGHILSYCGYLTPQEIRDILEMIAGFENKSEMECCKMRADRLMDKGRLADAVREYEHIIDGNGKKESQEFQGNVWHNLGTAYARLFFFEEAVMCFENAYLNNRRQQSLKSMLYAIRCSKDEKAYDRAIEKYQVTPEERDNIAGHVTTLSHNEEIVTFAEKLRQQKERCQNQQEYKDALTKQLMEWKQEYIKLCRI